MPLTHSDALSPADTRGVTVLLVVAGTATLASTMGRLIALLHDTDDQHLLLADPARIPEAVREGLRVTSSMPGSDAASSPMSCSVAAGHVRARWSRS